MRRGTFDLEFVSGDYVDDLYFQIGTMPDPTQPASTGNPFTPTDITGWSATLSATKADGTFLFSLTDGVELTIAGPTGEVSGFIPTAKSVLATPVLLRSAAHVYDLTLTDTQGRPRTYVGGRLLVTARVA